MKLMSIITLSLCACASARADIISNEPHALAGNRLYVGNLSWNTSSGQVAMQLDLTMGGAPLPPPAPGSGRVSNTNGDAVMGISLNGLPPGVPVIDTLALMSFFDVFVELSPDGMTSFYDTEMLSLSLQGVHTSLGAFMLRESPTMQSAGEYSVQAMPGGMYHIDSFFDVFTELSLDGGQTWSPSGGASRLTIMPAPGATALLGMCGLLAARRRRLAATA